MNSFPSAARRRIVSCAIAAASALSISTVARADVEQAKAYLGAARDDIKSGNFDSVARTLELFEDQLEGVDAGTVATLKAEAASIKKDAADKKAVAVFDDAEKALAKLEKDRDLARQLKAAQANPKDEDAVAFLGGAIQNCKNYEDEFLKKLPAGDPRTKQINDRYERFAMPILKVSLAAQRDQTLELLKKFWAQQQDQARQSFKDDAPMPYAKWREGSATAITSDLTYARASAARELLNDDKFKPFETAFADDAEVKSTFAELHKAYDEGVAALTKEVGGRVEAMDKGAPDNNNVSRVDQATRRLVELAPGNADAVALQSRVDKMAERWSKGEDAARAASTAKIDAMEKSAEEMWPAILAKYEGKTLELDPAAALADINSVKGKLVHVPGTAGNDYGSRDYAYCASVNGQPIAFKFNDRAKAAARVYEGVVQMPMSNNDFRDTIARVVGTGKVDKLMWDSIREQYVVLGQVDCVVCEVVAFKSRYVTVGEDAANTDAVK